LTDRYATAWAAARPYMRARKNDVHIPLSFWYAERLLERHAEADADVVLLAIMFHDTGWAVIDGPTDKAGTVVYTGLGGSQNLEAGVKKALGAPGTPGA